jgi:phospholipase C
VVCGRPTEPASQPDASTPERFGHVILVLEENHGFDEVIGDSAMPYLNSLADSFGVATEYYADTHPSIGNYFMLAAGQIVTNDDSYDQVVDIDNVVRRLLAAGRSWKSYAEDLPSVGYVGPDTGGYARKHNVFALLSDVAGDPSQRANLVPFSAFASDLAAGTLPDFSNIVPNLCDDGHDCSLAVADAWLRDNIGPLLASSSFQRDGLLIITFDEAHNSDVVHGGGRVAWIAVSPRARRGFRSSTLYQHASTLRLVLEGLGVDGLPGAAATAPAMDEFFGP